MIRGLIKTGLAVLLAGMLGACGFQPLYGENAGGARTDAELERIQVVAVDDGRTGHDVYNALIDRLSPNGEPANPDYQLQVRLRERREGVAIERDASITRYNYQLLAHYSLIDMRSGNVIHEGDSRSIASYNVVDSQFATLVAQRDAEERAATELSEDIKLRLAIFFDRQLSDGASS
jgi:LPS-assembly lipoprotein